MSSRAIRARPRRSGRPRPFALGRVLAVVGGVAMAAPLYLMFVFATHTDAEIASSPAPLWFGPHFLENVGALIQRRPEFWINLGMSLRVAVAVAILQVILCSLAGYAFALLEFRGKDLLFALLLATLLLPGVVGMIPHRLLIDRLGWGDTARGLIVPAASSALGIFLMRQYISRAVSHEILEAARLDGCGTTGTWWRIVLPSIRPALAALALIAFLGAWNDLAHQLMVLHDMRSYTAPLALRAMLGTGQPPLGALFAGAALITLPLVIAFALCARDLFRTLMVESSAGM